MTGGRRGCDPRTRRPRSRRAARRAGRAARPGTRAGLRGTGPPPAAPECRRREPGARPARQRRRRRALRVRGRQRERGRCGAREAPPCAGAATLSMPPPRRSLREPHGAERAQGLGRRVERQQGIARLAAVVEEREVQVRPRRVTGTAHLADDPHHRNEEALLDPEAARVRPEMAVDGPPKVRVLDRHVPAAGARTSGVGDAPLASRHHIGAGRRDQIDAPMQLLVALHPADAELGGDAIEAPHVDGKEKPRLALGLRLGGRLRRRRTRHRSLSRQEEQERGDQERCTHAVLAKNPELPFWFWFWFWCWCWCSFSFSFWCSCWCWC